MQPDAAVMGMAAFALSMRLWKKTPICFAAGGISILYSKLEALKERAPDAPGRGSH